MTAPDPGEVVRLRNRVAALERHNAELWACLNASDARLERVSAEMAEVEADRDTNFSLVGRLTVSGFACATQFELMTAERDALEIKFADERIRTGQLADEVNQAEAQLSDLAARVERVRDVVYALLPLPDPNNPEILFRVGQHDMAGRVKGVMGWPDKAPGARS